ncbi:MAG: arylsulfatase [Pirellulaceae bacterium]|nr:arylsulfatase [Pirellulaceae bacterium]
MRSQAGAWERAFSRWRSARSVSYFAIFVTGLVLVLARSTVSHAADSKPVNIVYILADDLGWGELGCFGQQKIPTPNIDRLAVEGMRLTQHYSGAPVCAPSRCVLMTGKHLGRAEIRGNLQAQKIMPQFTEGQYPLTEGAVTFPQLLKRAGFATGAMGKWGLGPVGSTGEPSQKGFDLFFGYNCQGVAHSFYPGYLWRNADKVTINQKSIPGHAKQPEGEVKLEDWIGENYAPKLMVAEAEKFIDSNAAKPFFLYLPFTEPHVAMHPPKETVEKFPTEWDSQFYRGESGYLPHPRPRAGYAAMISELDDHVGRVLSKLDAAGLTDKTLVIFSSDNGATHAGPAGTNFHIGGADPIFFNSTNGLRGYKGSVYEGGIRVPTIVRWPGHVKAGSVNETCSYFADWFPTLCDAVGLEKPNELSGESLWSSILIGTKIENRKPLIWIFPEYGGQVAVRLGDYKIVRQGLKSKKPGDWEVYNIDKDIGEKNNIAAEHEVIIQQVQKLLKKEVLENERFPLSIPGVNAT